ncbi:plays a role in the entry into G0 [Colletotrichum simmondsii]|uniref:Plays a role in the entry into G0 n=1 Tax=Colletotrichum simmondsii TaxID=703756 RepID=A0A135S8S5_9PEZI|nr:plays a role in the entry into G0 [Colletotrichum simmondsii]
MASISSGLAVVYPVDEGSGKLGNTTSSRRGPLDENRHQTPLPPQFQEPPISTDRTPSIQDEHLSNVPDPDPPLPSNPTTAIPKLSGTSITLTMTSLCLSATLSALDMTIVTTAVPNIVASLDSVAGYIWVGSAFILGFTAVTPVWGSVADLWGRKPIILLALTIFLAGSLLCALAPHMDALIAGRAVQGVVPIGGLVFIVLIFFLDLPSPNTPVLAGLKAIDWTGSALCMGGALMVLLALDFGDVVHPWSSATVICLIVFGAVVIGIFLVNEWKLAANPILPLRLLSSWSKAAAYSVFAFNAYVFIGITYYLPLYSQAVLGANALTSGLYMLPLIVSCSLSAAFAGVFIQRTGRYRVLMYAAQVLLILGTGLLINLEFDKNLAKLFTFQILTGVGVGLNIEAPVLAAQAATTVRDTAAVVATMGFLRSIATAISVVVGGVVFQNQMKAENPGLANLIGGELAGQFDGGNASAHVEDIGMLSANQQVPVRQAYFRALKTVWIMPRGIASQVCGPFANQSPQYVAFSGLALVLNVFVSEHHLSDERKAAVLGVDRGDPGLLGQPAQEEEIPLETTGRQQDNVHQLRNRAT